MQHVAIATVAMMQIINNISSPNQPYSFLGSVLYMFHLFNIKPEYLSFHETEEHKMICCHHLKVNIFQLLVVCTKNKI